MTMDEKRKENITAVPAADVPGNTEAAWEMPEIPYTMRKLQAADIPLFAKIVGKIGIDKLISCYGDEDFTDMLINLKNRRQMLSKSGAGSGGDTESGGGKKKSDDQFILGAAVVTRIANKVILNLDSCMQEVFRLVGNLAGITGEEVGQLDLEVFAAMIVRIIMENNIGNFIRAASALLK